jgi:hypothetical protein
MAEVSEASVAINSDSTVWTERVAYNDDQCWRYVFQMARPIPADLAVLVADTIHNIRSALDQVAYHLAERHVGELTEARRTEFPTTASAEHFDSWLERKHRAGFTRQHLYGPNEIRALRCVQPFALHEEAEAHFKRIGRSLGVEQLPGSDPSNDAAFVLDALWNIDKHRRLPQLSWGTSLVWWSHPDPSTQYLWWPSVDEGESVTNGTVIGRFCNPNGHERPSTDPVIEFGIHLDDCRSFGPSRLTETLDWLHRSICGWVIPRIFITAGGHEPPVMISFKPPVDGLYTSPT